MSEGDPKGLTPEFGPLQGLRVLDTARFVAGPWASTYLGEFGAEVIHLEGPPFERPYSDPTRTLPPLLPEGAPENEQISESWVQYSRNKLSVGIDIRKPEGRTVFLDLVRRADIWIESSRPGTFDRLDLSDRAVLEVNPRLTIVHVSGFGRTGEPARVRAPSFDLIGQAFSGYLSLQGNPDPDPPMRAGTALNDTVTGLAAATAALMGYIRSQRSGQGQAVDVAQYEVFFMLLENLALDYFARGVVRGRHGTAHARLHPYDLFRARDGWIVVAAPTQDSWLRLKGLLGVTDPSWDDPGFRRAHRSDVDAQIGEWCRANTLAELESMGASADVAISRVLTIADIAQDLHYRAREMFVEWTDPVAGRVKGAGVAPKFDRTPGGVWRGAPWLGQDNDRVLSGLLGYSGDRVAELRRTAVLGEDPPAGPPKGSVPHFLRGPV
jgi:crotonobetainyl-CoA:carnitine CoA-transferase CaiB-like acyl-CoA transferase